MDEVDKYPGGLLPFLIYKALKPGPSTARRTAGLLPFLIYKALKADMKITNTDTVS